MTTETLHLAFISRDAAKNACEKWHYSKAVPAGKNVFVGVWENGRFIGTVIFGGGSNKNSARPFGVKQDEIAELVRVALDTHECPVSRIVSIAIRLLRKQSPGLRILVSYADTAQGHHGGIYQAGGWAYVGDSFSVAYRIHGKLIHSKTIADKYKGCVPLIPYLRANVDPNVEMVETDAKHKYVLPLDPRMKATVDSMRLPYPKRAGSDTGDTARSHRVKGGLIPTPALSKKRRSSP